MNIQAVQDALENGPSETPSLYSIYRELQEIDSSKLSPEELTILRGRIQNALDDTENSEKLLNRIQRRLVRVSPIPSKQVIVGF